MTANAVEAKSVVKKFGEGTPHEVTALREVSLAIRKDEFFTLLGPSGCGKTTLLRLIAGFEQPTKGAILLYGEHMGDLPPNYRPTNMVFQHYALFPHMSVAENVAFGLNRLKRPKEEVEGEVRRMLALVKLDQLADRRPAQLSGGQQQRVALARALAPGPKVVLLDEPLAALDLKLRQEMRMELKQIQKEAGVTFIFVTHDQEEALSMSDRIAVMSDGEVQQIGLPSEVYEYPVNRFVAAFIGDANFIDARIVDVENGIVTCEAGACTTLRATDPAGHAVGDAVTLFLRPEKVVLHRGGDPGSAAIQGQVRNIVYVGNSTAYRIDIGDGVEILAQDKNLDNGAQRFSVGDRLHLTIGASTLRVLAQ